MTNQWYTSEELIKYYESMKTAHRIAVSKYVRMVMDIQECGIVINQGDSTERAIRKHCGDVPRCAFFWDCAKAIREDNEMIEATRHSVKKVPHCTFCGKKVNSTELFIGGDGDTLICASCVRLCMEMVESQQKKTERQRKKCQARTRKPQQRYSPVQKRSVHRQKTKKD